MCVQRKLVIAGYIALTRRDSGGAMRWAYLLRICHQRFVPWLWWNYILITRIVNRFTFICVRCDVVSMCLVKSRVRSWKYTHWIAIACMPDDLRFVGWHMAFHLPNISTKTHECIHFKIIVHVELLLWMKIKGKMRINILNSKRRKSIGFKIFAIM